MYLSVAAVTFVSLASVAGQAATNVSAEGGIFGSIKNFFAGDRSLKAQKDKAE